MLWDKMGTFWTKERYSCKGDVSFHTLEAALIGEGRLNFLVLYPDCQLKLMVPHPLGF